MTYFKCKSCKARLYSVASPDSLACDLCPGCGATLEAVGELVEAGGYHSIADRLFTLTLSPVRAAPVELPSG
jgi:hypothetical protein